jgi:hypothetical protein
MNHIDRKLYQYIEYTFIKMNPKLDSKFGLHAHNSVYIGFERIKIEDQFFN